MVEEINDLRRWAQAKTLVRSRAEQEKAQRTTKD